MSKIDGEGLKEGGLSMSQLLQSREFLFGAIILLFYQSSKFGELNTRINVGPSYSVPIPNLRAKDYSSKFTYYIFLLLFLLASITVYSFICATPTVIVGWLKVSGADSALQSSVQSTSFPLYVVAVFIGITHSIPNLPNFSNFQRDLFHGILGIPAYVVEVSENFLNDVMQRCHSDEEFDAEIDKLKDPSWIASIDRFADTAFYRVQVESLKLEGDGQVAANRSRREQRYIIGQLIYSACVATVRESGRRGLSDLAKRLDVDPPHSDIDEIDPILQIVIWGIVCATILWIAIPALHGLERMLLSDEVDRWPEDLAQSAHFISTILLPILIAAIVALAIARTRLQRSREGGNAVFYLGLILFIVVFDVFQSLYDIGTYNVAQKGILDILTKRLPIYLLHSVISVFVCVVLLDFILRKRSENDLYVKVIYASVMLCGVIALSMFYAFSKMYFHFEKVITIDYFIIIVIINIAASMLAMFGAFKLGARVHDAEGV